jgi:plastocyanin
MTVSRNTITRMTLSVALLASLVLGGLALATSASVAQDMTESPHPAHLHAGTCEAPGDVIFPLSDVSSDFLVDGESAAGTMMGPDTAVAVQVSVTTVEASLVDIVEGGHTVVVHESAENIANYIACGDVGGMMLGDANLPIGLGPLNDSGYSGAVWFEDNGDGTTTATVFLVSGNGDAMGSAMSGMDHDMGGSTSVAIEGFAFNPPMIIVDPGTTITWTNNDSAPHTVTQRPTGDGFQSGTMNQGDTFSHTFEESGTYEYSCEFHGNMAGIVVVN